MLDYLLFAIFPYVAVVLAIVVTTHRFIKHKFSFTSSSTQFLENKTAFWGLTLWHYGMLPVLLVHIFVLAFPKVWTKLLGDPIRIYLVEVLGLALGLAALLGIILLIFRRLTNARMRVISTKKDFLVAILLLLQILTGVGMATHYMWGSVWSAHTAVPWLWSLIKLNPQVDYIATMPWMIKFHFFNAFLLIAAIPFTKLVHFLALPLTYLVRPHQVVVWNRNRKKFENKYK